MSCLKPQGSVEKKTDQSTYTFTWKIPDFHKICPENCTNFPVHKSPIFYGGDIDNKQLRWFVYLKGNDGKISCYLTLIHADLDCLKEENRSVKCAFEVGLGNKNYPYHVSQSTKGLAKVFAKEGSSWGYDCLLNIADLYKEKKDIFLPGNTLQVTAQLKIFGESTTMISPIGPINSSTYLTSIQKKVSDDYRQLFTTKKFSDIEIKCGKTSFHCHRSILQARSKVFCGMFDCEMTESFKKLVVIDDMEPETLSSLLLYIYTGSVELSEGGSWAELIYGAEKYDLIELKNYCFDKLFETANDDNIGELALNAYRFNPDEKIKEIIKKYCQIHMGRLMENSAFRKLFVKHPGAFYEDLDPEKNKRDSPKQP